MNLTPAMLADFATCPRRYEMAHVRCLRSSAHLRYDQNVRAALDRCLTAAVRHRSAPPLEAAEKAATEGLVAWWTDTKPDHLGKPDEHALARRLIHSAAAEGTQNPLALYPKTWLAQDRHGNELLDVLVSARLPRRRIDGSLGGRGATLFRSYVPAVFLESKGRAVLRLHHYTHSTDQGDVRFRLARSMAWRGTAWAVEQITGLRVVAVDWIIVRLKRPSPLPVTISPETPTKLGRANTDTDLYEIEMTLREHPDLVGTDAAAYWIQRLSTPERRFVYGFRFDADPLATQEWMQDAVAWDTARLRAHRANTWPRNDSACVSRGVLCAYASTCVITGETESEARFIRVTDDGLPSNRKEFKDVRAQRKGNRSPRVAPQANDGDRVE